MSVIQIVSGLPPLVDGVGDYALNLALALAQNHNIHTHFVACNLAWTGAESVEGFPVYRLGDRTPAALLRALAEAGADDEKDAKLRTVLLHLSPYGYDKNACPFWLVEGLQSWKRKGPKRRLVTMFHELYAFGPPWKKAFWLSPLQRWVTARLARLSDTALTSTYEYAAKLVEWDDSKNGRVDILSVISNVGEPARHPPLSNRAKRMVVFGQRTSRERVYRCSTALSKVCRALNIEEICDIGPAFGAGPLRIDGIQVVKMGVMPAEMVSNLMLDAVAGVIAYPSSHLGKSGVFAAYCAHGLVPVNCGDARSRANGLEAGIQYVASDACQSQLKVADAQMIADNALGWYRTHDTQKQAKRFSTILRIEATDSVAT